MGLQAILVVMSPMLYQLHSDHSTEGQTLRNIAAILNNIGQVPKVSQPSLWYIIHDLSFAPAVVWNNYLAFIYNT